MRFTDHQLLEKAYTNIQQAQLVNEAYINSNLKDIFSKDVWNSNSLEAKLMFIEAFSIGQQYQVLEEGMLSSLGKAAMTPIQLAGKIYMNVSKPIGEFIEKYGYEKTKLKEIDEKTYNAIVTKFGHYLDKLNPQAASFIKKTLNEAQGFVKGNPIKMSLLAVALTTAMSFAGAPTLAIFAAACLVRGTIGLLKGEKPIQAFGKSLLVGVIGKVLGLAGKEVFKYFASELNSSDVGNTAEVNYSSPVAIDNPTSMKAFEIIAGKPFDINSRGTGEHALMRIIHNVFQKEGGSGGVHSKAILSTIQNKIKELGGLKSLQTTDPYSSEGKSTIDSIVKQIRQQLSTIQGVNRNQIGTFAKIFGKDPTAPKKMFDQLN